MINKDGGGGDNFQILWKDTAGMRGDIELMGGVPPLGKTLPGITLFLKHNKHRGLEFGMGITLLQPGKSHISE